MRISDWSSDVSSSDLTGTDYRPVRSVVQASVTCHGTNVIQGLAISMEATAVPALIICAGIIVTFLFAGLLGIAIAVSTMLALAGMVVALDAYGPVTDRSEEHTSELQSLMRISYAVFCFKNKKTYLSLDYIRLLQIFCCYYLFYCVCF